MVGDDLLLVKSCKVKVESKKKQIHIVCVYVYIHTYKYMYIIIYMYIYFHSVYHFQEKQFPELLLMLRMELGAVDWVTLHLAGDNQHLHQA